jgi:hyperosmotically inducible protein
MFRLLISAVTALAFVISAGTATLAQKNHKPQVSQKQAREDRDARVVRTLAREVRHELAMLPYYGIFDWLEGEVKADGTVILRGQVIRPTTKSDAEGRVKDVEGVERVVNEIEVLPLSPNDDRLRLAVYRAIFDWNSPLFRYATQAVPPIHIIVKNGNVTLKGVVANKTDSNLANIKANGVPGVFSVRNELRVENDTEAGK